MHKINGKKDDKDDENKENKEEEEEEEQNNDDSSKSKKTSKPMPKTKKGGKQACALKQKKDKVLTPVIKPVTKSGVQKTIDQISIQITKASMGYALMDVMTDNDFGRGPQVVVQYINPREINSTFLRLFGADVERHGLQNKDIKNAITVGVCKNHIQAESLQGMKQGDYTNVVKWTSDAKKEGAKMLLYNRNHRRTYMRTLSKVIAPYHQYLHAKRELEESQSDGMRTSFEAAKEGAFDIVEASGWFILLLKANKIEKSTLHTLLEHNLASNDLLIQLADNEDD
ncbi:hypothetical protein BDR07DRAFT_1613853 [Suillus spraguei]|nr:hypothetical protein BDR07DRAFT_1493628 [Suillus spraguei]KAG2355125.1 hypothetical protein BDR07DRAFT_1613853 [Suillus spraguei]